MPFENETKFDISGELDKERTSDSRQILEYAKSLDSERRLDPDIIEDDTKDVDGVHTSESGKQLVAESLSEDKRFCVAWNSFVSKNCNENELAFEFRKTLEWPRPLDGFNRFDPEQAFVLANWYE